MWLGEDEVTQMMGLGCPGDTRLGADGNLYQWVQGVDGLGNPFGFWKRLRRGVRRFARRALPLARRFAPLIPGGAAAAAAFRAATPLLRRAVPYIQQVAPMFPGVVPAAAAAVPAAMPAEAAEAPDEGGTAGWGLGEDELTQMMGVGYLGEVRAGPDGNAYQWVQGVDGLGNPIGFWKRLRRGIRRFARRALPLVQRAAAFIPGPYGAAISAGLRTASPFLRQAGMLGSDGIGALYEAPDGTLYQVQGLSEDEELRGLAEDEELRGFAEDEELRGLAEDEELRGLDEDEELRGYGEDEELRGLAEDEELRGLAEDEELRGFAEDEELRGFAEDEDLRGIGGFVRQNGVSGLEAFVPDKAPQTPWFTAPAQPPVMWAPLW